MRRLLVIAGDRAEPAGPFHGALEAIDCGLIARHGIATIGIAGYPDGHPRIADHELDRLLAAKLEAADAIGLKVDIVTQFCLDAAPILAWLKRLRAHGIDHPVRIGLAGPTSLTDADALRAPLRRARLGAGARAQCRPDQAPARRRGARRIVRALIEANRDGEARRHRAASLFVRRHRGDRAMDGGRRGGPDQARPRRVRGGGGVSRSYLPRSGRSVRKANHGLASHLNPARPRFARPPSPLRGEG